MSNLLQIVRIKPEAMERKGVFPLMLEFNVDPQTAPYLVSSSSDFLWLESPHTQEGKTLVKAAIRKGGTLSDLFWSATKMMYDRALQDQWGSIHSFSEEGLEAAVAHIQSYDLGEVDILVAPAGPDKERPQWLQDLDPGQRLRVTSWVPEDCIVVVPAERQFLGLLIRLSHNTAAISIHNASRGFAMCWDGTTKQVPGVQATFVAVDKPQDDVP